jgi:TPR repeat protein
MTPNKLDKLRASAERGIKQDMYDLALAYKNGDGIKKNVEQFFEWMRKAALAGHPDGMHDIAWAYADGDGTDPNSRLFFEWMKKAAEEGGDEEAMYNLALAYKDGKGTEKDDQQFFEWMKKAAEKNHREAMYHLASAYEEGLGTDPDQFQYFEWTKKIADAGEPGAMLRLATAYKNGKGTSPDNRKFYEYTKKAIEPAAKAAKNAMETGEREMAFEDLPTAMYNLALAYRDGTGTNRHIGRYFEWMKQAAEAAEAAIQEAEKEKQELKLGDIPTAMFKLALAYKDGEGTRRSTKKYFAWLTRAAEVGLPAAMVELAFAYRDGRGTNRDMRQYCKWMERAAKAGHSEGMYRIALAYGTGVGRRYDTDQFLEWINKAVEDNHPEAFIAQGIAELQKSGLIGKAFMPFFEKLTKLHEKVKEIQQGHILKEHDKDASGVVAHYTVLPALYSMLPEKLTAGQKANCLRLYNIAYVNDPREGRRLLSVDKETMQPLKNSEFLLAFFPPGSEKAPEHPIPWEGQKFSVYVGSFALAPDRLDLWRAYGSDGFGYCIVTPLSVFNQESDLGVINLMQNDLLTESIDNREQIYTDIQPTLYKVHYTKEEAENTLTRLAEILKEIKAAKDIIIKDHEHVLSESDLKAGKDLIDSIVRSIVSGIMYLYKDDEYENEKEARILMGFDITAKCLKLEVNKEHDPPHVYVETKAFLFESEQSEIIIGPKVERKTAAYLNLQKRLAINNMLQTQVRMSEIKYR